MGPLLKKMNFREGQKIRIWNLPEELSFLEKEWEEQGFLAKESEKPDFLIGFVQGEPTIRKIFEEIKPLVQNDETLWFAYPKGSSKRYQASINRDKGWKALGEAEMEAVRQISISEDWSALRFRNVKFIKSLTRKFSAKDQ
ncbi:MAG: hypothetical protein HWE15_05780 [Algoriphagus sp.]|uniref:hypothetical protein n=1 Tax=Algoriphagus sp. TaxID=1872435 RepID=UPI00180B26D3|nr:hypothetical protein [Algoriphagus sp.]NVJ85794.1 hypothetical protein [Algoriphagus sp.]